MSILLPTLSGVRVDIQYQSLVEGKSTSVAILSQRGQREPVATMRRSDAFPTFTPPLRAGTHATASATTTDKYMLASMLVAVPTVTPCFLGTQPRNWPEARETL